MPEGLILPTVLTVPPAMLAIIGLVIYWVVLKNARPRSRRRIRRANAIVQIVLVFALVNGLSLAEWRIQPTAFIVAWIGVIGLTSLTITLALLDSFNNVRVYRRDRRELRR